MKAVGIIGYHKSGKTTLGLKLCREFSNRGLRVGVVKHVSCELRLADADTSRYRLFASVVAAASPAEAEIIVKGQKRLEDMIPYFADCDVMLVEGFKKQSMFPKIVCLREREEEKELFDGLEMFTASFKEGLADYLISNDAHVGKMAAVALEKAFEINVFDLRGKQGISR
ncbi:MAG: molybdopterin-guanine dinucleotide biosynthesis protein B [Desulfatiglandales bacterium]